uniref:Uncharacterized protein n=1 Tax=Arabidopsis thaliana TaxID=3702 RepID=Q56WF3_ARATH|nr:hypothetical protein [Arabidopsis thaliana]BAD95015.1 hypothetical protein [Arabidopsis thaliana]
MNKKCCWDPHSQSQVADKSDAFERVLGVPFDHQAPLFKTCGDATKDCSDMF